MLIHRQTWSDFVLALDFKISRGCNSGVFVRTYPLTPRPGKDVGFNGIEVAIDDTKTAGFHDTGAIYDLVKPSKNVMKPVGQWNHLVITCDGPKLSVELNGEMVTRMDLDRWNTPSRRPDGSEHKFDIAYKDHPRFGYIGLAGSRIAVLVQKHQALAAESVNDVTEGELIYAKIARLNRCFGLRPNCATNAACSGEAQPRSTTPRSRCRIALDERLRIKPQTGKNSRTVQSVVVDRPFH